MSTDLFLITDSTLTGKETDANWQEIVVKLNNLNLNTTTYTNAKLEEIKEHGDWDYSVEDMKGYSYCVRFHGPFAIVPRLFSNIGILITIYRYNLLDVCDDLYWFNSFRQDLFNIVKIIGGTEVIYLADNACDKLSYYLDSMAYENVPYKEIKEKLIAELGEPITDYEDMEVRGYKEIKNFFLDDFTDLENQNQ